MAKNTNIDRFPEPEPDPETVDCECCGDDYYEHDLAPCGGCDDKVCEDCMVDCNQCGHPGCTGCMEKHLDDYYCDNDGECLINKGIELAKEEMG